MRTGPGRTDCTTHEPTLVLGVALAFGLTVLAMAYAGGHISGGHVNPAVTWGVAASGRMGWSDTAPSIVTELVSGIVAGAVLLAARLPGDRGAAAFFQVVILGATDTRAPQGLAPLAIGQGWLFVAPIVGAVIAGFGYRALLASTDAVLPPAMEA